MVKVKSWRTLWYVGKPFEERKEEDGYRDEEERKL